jgi:hypothetical protein
MKRNQILIISGILIIGLLIGVVFWMQFTEGNIESDKSKITFTIHNSEPIAQDKSELRDLILSPLLKTIMVNDSMVIPSIILLKKYNGTNSFSIPLYGMNYIRYAYIGADMYSFEDRKSDEESFFKSWSNSSDLEASLLKGNGDEKEFPTLDEVNGIDTFIISSSIQKGNKVWPDVTSLRNHLDSMLISGALRGKQNIHLYFISILNGPEELPKPPVEDIVIVENPKNIPPLKPIDTKAPKVGSDFLISRVVDKNEVIWDIKGLSDECKLNVVLYSAFNNELIKSMELKYDTKSLRVNASDLKLKFPKKVNLECIVIVNVIFQDKIIAKSKSDVISFYCNER